MQTLAIENISVFGLPRVAFVELAADLGCQHISTTVGVVDYGVEAYPTFSLKDDAALRGEMITAMRDRGVSLSLGEGLVTLSHIDVRDAYAADIDAMSELGVPRINACGFDPDLPRCFDQIAALAEMAAAGGMETVVEFAPVFSIRDLPTALSAIRHVGRRDCRLLIDTMHCARIGTSAADLAEVDPDLIGYVQLSDAPLVPIIESYMEEARFERMAPGDGGLPLLDILAALPPDRVIGLEIPIRSEAKAGIGPRARMSRCVEAARTLLDQVAQRRSAT